ncbi:MAG TPA: radical SAM protein [Aggregatilineaceae bacterium]|nr:radical SAM protein [Aggregatilineaceae bacterium]
MDEGHNTIRLHRPVTQFTKIYVEPTTLCNLDCVTCIRNVWDEPMGRRRETTSRRVLEAVKQIWPRPNVFFGGLGEPLFHLRTPARIAQFKAIGARVDLITNGTPMAELISKAVTLT